ncbi:MAG: hypothetical protein PHQ96_05970 [Candidatus Omnitrophica bacterium]|nr:hypothetical protein [Candidatus Omnitrophota bacterium]
MKKIFLILLPAILICLFSFAQDQAPANQTAVNPADIKIFKGNIAQVEYEERTRDFPARIDAIDERTQRLVFVVADKIPIRAKDGSAISLRKVKNENKIVMEYVKKHGNKIVQSITVVE